MSVPFYIAVDVFTLYSFDKRLRSPAMLLQVALPVPLYRVFDYRLPADTPTLPNGAAMAAMPLPPIGSRVEVPFGRQTLIGIVIAHIEEAARC